MKEAWAEAALPPASEFAASATPCRVFAEAGGSVAGASALILEFLLRQPRAPGADGPDPACAAVPGIPVPASRIAFPVHANIVDLVSGLLCWEDTGVPGLEDRWDE